MSRAKGPQILGMYKPRYGDGESLRVIITAKQFRKLPEWVQRHVHWEYSGDDDDHREIAIQAKDELEAMMRFNKLWAGLPKIGE